MRLIGDAHGKIGDYLSIIRDVQMSIQLGDMSLDYSALPTTPHIFIGGNHDNYSVDHPCRRNWGMHDGWFLIRGAESTDKALRFERIDWWADEQLTPTQCELVIEEYERARPDYVASHDCPQMALQQFGITGKGSRTNQLLQALYDIHQPKRWIFGHHHTDMMLMYDKGKCVMTSQQVFAGREGDYTIFQCLNELSYIDIPSSGKGGL